MKFLPSLILSVCATVILAGCNQENAVHTTYQCEGGDVLNARFVDGKYVEVTWDGLSFTIPRIEEKSGARYEVIAEGRLFWSKGIDALFIPYKGAAPLKCRRG